jgi:hypothetical protein
MRCNVSDDPFAPIPDARRGLLLRSSPLAALQGGERIVENVPIAEQATGEMSVELVDFGLTRAIPF